MLLRMMLSKMARKMMAMEEEQWSPGAESLGSQRSGSAPEIIFWIS